MSQALTNLIPAVISIAIICSLVAVFLAALRRHRDRQKEYQDQLLASMDAQLKSIDQQTAALERIATALERPQSN
jgi:hypothetical protein